MKRFMAVNQAGFSPIIIVIILVIVAAGGFTAQRVITHKQSTNTTTPSNNNYSKIAEPAKKDCSGSPQLKTPVDLSKVSSILYPGQYRGNEYKAHGGFRFDNYKPEDITVRAPLDARIERASRYIQSGEVQILLEFSADCDIAYRFDHVLKVAPALQAMIDNLPAPTSDSRTTVINPPLKVRVGDILATAVGMTKSNNTFVDFGVYDQNHKNEAAKDPTWAAKHANTPHDLYGVCWFDLLPADDAAKVRSLPAADSTNGKTSDYCN